MDEEEFVIQRVEFTETPQQFLKSLLKESQAGETQVVEAKKEAMIEEKKEIKTRATEKTEIVVEPKQVTN